MTISWPVRLATLGPIGYFSSSGLLATLLTLPLVYLFHAMAPSLIVYAMVTGVLFMVGMFVVRVAVAHFNSHEDPPQIVFDELVGCLLVFCGITLSAQSVVIGFLLFRALDWITCDWTKRAEKQMSAWAIMADDIIAALLANAALRYLF